MRLPILVPTRGGERFTKYYESLISNENIRLIVGISESDYHNLIVPKNFELVIHNFSSGHQSQYRNVLTNYLIANHYHDDFPFLLINDDDFVYDNIDAFVDEILSINWGIDTGSIQIKRSKTKYSLELNNKISGIENGLLLNSKVIVENELQNCNRYDDALYSHNMFMRDKDVGFFFTNSAPIHNPSTNWTNNYIFPNVINKLFKSHKYFDVPKKLAWKIRDKQISDDDDINQYLIHLKGKL